MHEVLEGSPHVVSEGSPNTRFTHRILEGSPYVDDTRQISEGSPKASRRIADLRDFEYSVELTTVY